jgi:hypothetical protein
MFLRRRPSLPPAAPPDEPGSPPWPMWHQLHSVFVTRGEFFWVRGITYAVALSCIGWAVRHVLWGSP